jgi:hypothetical protein
MSETKIIIRVGNLDDNNLNSIIICLTVTPKMIDQCLLATRMVSELECPDNGCAPAEVAITVPALVYTGSNMDDDLRDQLWDDYEGRVVKSLPEFREEPVSNSVSLIINTSVYDENRLDNDCIWVRYFNPDSPDTFSQPIGWLSKTVSKMFQQKQIEGRKQ